jgi:hypothetical protein
MNNSAAYGAPRTWIGARMVDRTRRNHGLEHATVTVLTQKHPGLRLAGRSTPFGFYIYGRVETEALRAAVAEALGRLKAGELHLAVHPNCGTNLIAKGLAAGLTSYFSFLGANTTTSRLRRLPRVAVLSGLALMLAQPLGLALQRHLTTSAEIRDMRIVSLKRSDRGGLVTHFVTTAD